jgi:hypothetical protein
MGSMASLPLRRILLDGSVALMLLACLAIVFMFDRQSSTNAQGAPSIPVPAPEPEREPEPPPEPPVIALPEEVLPPVDPVPRITVGFTPEMRFGVSTTTGNPEDPSDDGKQLTFDDCGDTNNTRLWVDGSTPMVGDRSGRSVRPMQRSPEGAIEAAWIYGDIQVTQTILIIPGQTSRRMDTIQVDYRLENQGSTSHEVGLRVMLDSLIGGNDGVPFIVPGQEQMVTRPQTFTGEQVPDFVRALEVPNLVNPGVIADLGLRPDEGERPGEVILTQWPGSNAAWNYDRTSGFAADTAIGLFYASRTLAPTETRQIRFTYGLGSISSTTTKNTQLSLTAGGPFQAGGKFWLVALVQSPRSGQQVQLELPGGFRLAAGHDATQPVATGANCSQISWLIEIESAAFGPASIVVKLAPDGVQELQQIVVEPRNARLVLHVQQPVRSGKRFWISALVQHAKAGQSLQLDFPEGLKLADGHSPIKPVPVTEGYAQVSWLVSATGVRKAVLVAVRLLPEGLREEVTLDIEPGTMID